MNHPGPDPFKLQRFVEAQDRPSGYRAAVEELREGRKRSHWMWFIFPQLAGLGRSPTARYYAIRDLAEARAYLAHPVLGAHLRECTRTLAGFGGRRAEDILGSIDAIKLRSSMTLFARADPEERLFQQVLHDFFAEQPDPLTERLLERLSPDSSRGAGHP